ncbi:MAG: T9SS type A sorting domain-containing protein [Chitinivibrionales bacterium]|nr:T9SS type A sorting domain-containing protein [Chitinivibrionales bacterium]
MVDPSMLISGVPTKVARKHETKAHSEEIGYSLSNGFLAISVPVLTGSNYRVMLHDLSGRSMISQNGSLLYDNGSIFLNTHGLTGTYVLRITGSKTHAYSRKIVIQ